MSENDLYNVMRPKNFRQLIANCKTIATLENDARAKRLKHTYLLIGDRGCGKTTTARVLAKSHDCVTEDVQNIQLVKETTLTIG